MLEVLCRERKYMITPEQESIFLQEANKRKLAFYRPYPKQIEFHNSSATYRETLLMAGNQLGKCCSKSSYLELFDGSRLTYGELYERGLPFDVLSWDGEKVVKAKAVSPIKKPAEPCVRLWFSDGKWLEVALNHRLLSSSGIYVFCEQLLGSVPCLPSSSLERAQSAHVLDAPRLIGKLQDFLVNCLASFRYGDELLRRASNSVRFFLQRLSDVQQHNFVLSSVDGYSSTNTNNHRLKPFLPSSQDVFPLIVGRCAELTDRASYKFFQCMTGCIRVTQKLLIGSLVRLQLNDVSECGKSKVGALLSPFGGEGNQIIAYQPVPSQEVYDFTVPVYKNYITAGVVHHNTYAAAAQTAMHATGIYPDWYRGRKFKKAPVIWCAGETGATVRDTIQKLLIGDLANPGTGLLPSGSYETTPSRGVADLVDTIIVNHNSGSKTRITFKYYEQQREKFQADSVDFVWLDEEPNEDIYLEALTRTNATGGYLIMTFTPLKGQSKVVKRFTRESSPDRHVVTMTIDDALHIPVEKRQQIINSYAKHEREARIYGKPIPGSGQIFPVSREDISCDPFPMDTVPFFWQELAGIDFGGSGEDGHPTAAVKILYDTQGDIIYVTNTYRRKGGTTMVHAAALRPWGKVPFAWPHDGLIHDKGSGVPLRDSYFSEGLNMLPENARFEDGSNGVEAGIDILLQRMETGRLKIFSHLHDLFEEIGSYYRDDGKIIKVDEDLVCALRYSAAMCLRFAKRVNQPKGARGGYPIEDLSSNQTDPYFRKDYNPLSHKYIDEMLGVKR